MEAFECAHQSGQCPLCRDKDLRIAQLTQQIDQLKNKVFGRSSERRGKGQKNKDGSGSDGKGKPQAAHRTRLPSERFPEARVEEVTLEDPTPPPCSECELPMTDSGMRETSERIEYRPAELYILKTHRVGYHCKCCQSAPKSAKLPERLAPGSHLGDSFIIQACISKFYDLLPTTRHAKILARNRTAISHNLLLKGQSIMAFVLGAVYRALRQEITQSQVIFADETIHRQLEENGGQWRWYLWGFGNQTSIYFEIHDTRAGDVSIEFLKESAADFLVSDAYSGYHRTIREVNELRQSQGQRLLQSSHCNDHARRYWFYAQSQSDSIPQIEKVLALYERIYAIEREVQDGLRSPLYEEPKNTEEALKLRQTADPLFHQIYDISCEVLLEAPEKSAEATAAKYFLNHQQGLTLYLQHIELPISNAFTERSLRDPVILRKTSLGNHSQAGAEEAAIQLSVMGSCKRVGVNPTQYLEFTTKRYLAQQPLFTPNQYKRHLKLNPQPQSAFKSKSQAPPDTS